MEVKEELAQGNVPSGENNNNMFFSMVLGGATLTKVFVSESFSQATLTTSQFLNILCQNTTRYV